MDCLIFNFLNGFALKNQWLDAIFVFLAKYLPYVLAAALLLFLIKDFKKYRRMVFLAFMAGGFSEVIVQIIRWFWQRPRPFMAEQVNLLLSHSTSGSFPSAHAAFFFALSTIVFFFNKKAGLFFYIASLLMAVSRIIVGVHWPSDILAGAILGILCGYLIKKIFSIFKK